MEVIIDQKHLLKAFSVIKKSSAFCKMEGEEEIPMLIEAKDNTLSFTVSNVAFWSKTNLDKKSYEGDDDLSDQFTIKNEGKIYIDGSNFVNLISTYPEQSILTISIKKENEGQHLMVETIKIGKQGRTKKSGFISMKKPAFFEEEPLDEKRKKITVETKILCEAVNAVESITSSEEMLKYLWGVKVEIFGKEDIAACASNKMKICWYDENFTSRDGSKKPLSVCPIKSGLVSVTKSLDKNEETEVEIGEKYTVFKQLHQHHAVPNAIQSGSDKMPDWRSLTEKMDTECRTMIKVPKDDLINCVKSSNLATGGRFGIRINFDTNKKEMGFSLNSVGDDTVIKSYHNETEPLEDNQISGDPIDDSLVITIDDLKDILNKFPSEMVTFKIKDTKSAIQITDEKQHFRFITSLVRSAVCQMAS